MQQFFDFMIKSERMINDEHIGSQRVNKKFRGDKNY